MSNIKKQFQKKSAYIAYLTVGDGDLQRTYESLLALVQGGVDILEIGIPFSDPIADGPVIQGACQRALENKITLKDIFSLIKQLRKKTQIPIILFSYYNPIFVAKNFYAEAKKSGVDGCLIVDLPLEEAAPHLTACEKENIDPILLVAPSSSKERIQIINQHSKGMLYYVSHNGTTGKRLSLPINFREKISAIKSISSLPIAAGFGIANRKMASETLKYADGFVVGSLFVEAVAKGISPADLTQLVKSIDPR